ncbi:MAG TPA: nuclear transport factor 2 family protein [Solirubrobacteraceae bacterium]|jgi:ketosteroid isomerase-like protein
MSQEHVELVRSIYADWERGDFSSSDWADPEIEFVFVGGPTPGRSTGAAAMAQAWREFLESWSRYHAEPEAFRDLDDGRVLVLIRGVARGRASGLDVDLRNANVFQIADGKVTRLALYSDSQQALEELGLEQ